MRYRADPAAYLRIVPLDSLTAIYHRPSGQTHVVAEPVPELLAALGGDPVDLDALIGRLKIENSSENRNILTERLGELVAIGLVSTA